MVKPRAYTSISRAKTTAISLAIFGFLLVVGWLAYQSVAYQSVPRTTVTLNGVAYNALVPADEAAREKGLSGSQPLGKNDAMLFVFPHDDKWGIWMKDMKYSIDIVWLDNNKRVVYLVKSADPESYPATTFYPEKPVRYIIELSTGTIAARNLKIDDKVEFDLSSLRGRVEI